MSESGEDVWDNFIASCSQAHLLQSGAWGKLKSLFGWQVVRVISGSLGAQILFRSLPLGYSLAYIPKGPVTSSGQAWKNPDWPRWLAEVDGVCRARKTVFLKLEPDAWEDPGQSELPAGFIQSKYSVQPPRTLVVDLSVGEEALLHSMKQKTRYNIRLAQKRGVIISSSTDVDSFFSLMQATGRRDAFGVHSLSYYHQVYSAFCSRGEVELLFASYKGEKLAGLMAFAHGSRSWYLYGASSDVHRELMPTYLIQWEAMSWAKRRGCTSYDLWGVPDYDLDSLEAAFDQRQDGLWGVYRFKRGFGGMLVRAAGPWDRVYHLPLYRLYQLRMRLRKGGDEPG